MSVRTSSTANRSSYRVLAATLRAVSSLKEANTSSIHLFSFLPAFGFAQIWDCSIQIIRLGNDRINGVATLALDDFFIKAFFRGSLKEFAEGTSF